MIEQAAETKGTMAVTPEIKPATDPGETGLIFPKLGKAAVALKKKSLD